MKQAIKALFLIAIISLPAGQKVIAQTQNIAATEKTLRAEYAGILKYMDSDADKANQYAVKFGAAFEKLIKSDPATLNYAFPLLTKDIFIRTSSDGNFRVYSWDTWTGGTMHFFNEIYQYKSNGKVLTFIPVYNEGDPGSFCSKIYTIPVEGKTYYLKIFNGIYSTVNVSQSVSVYRIDNGKLITTDKLFKTKTKLLNRIDVDFNFFTYADRPERPLELITYDEQQKIIYIPVINGAGQATGNNLIYQLRGSYFEYSGVQKENRDK